MMAPRTTTLNTTIGTVAVLLLLFILPACSAGPDDPAPSSAQADANGVDAGESASGLTMYTPEQRPRGRAVLTLNGPRLAVLDFGEGRVAYRTPSDYRPFLSALSADGSRLIFSGRGPDDQWGIWKVDLPGGQLDPLGFPAALDTPAVTLPLGGVSPDGRSVLYTAIEGYDPNGSFEGPVLWRAGSISTPSIGDFDNPTPLAIPPDGSTALYIQGNIVYRAPLGGGGPTVVYDFDEAPTDDYPEDPSPGRIDLAANGSIIALSGLNPQDRRSIAILRDGALSEAVTYQYGPDSAKLTTGFDIDPAGERVAVNIGGKLHIKQLGTGSLSPLGEAVIIGPPAFTADGSGLVTYVLDNPDSDRSFALQYTDLDSGATSILARSPDLGFPSPGFAPLRWAGDGINDAR